MRRQSARQNLEGQGLAADLCGIAFCAMIATMKQFGRSAGGVLALEVLDQNEPPLNVDYAPTNVTPMMDDQILVSEKDTL